jgi:hypothetical protein
MSGIALRLALVASVGCDGLHDRHLKEMAARSHRAARRRTPLAWLCDLLAALIVARLRDLDEAGLGQLRQRPVGVGLGDANGDVADGERSEPVDRGKNGNWAA